MTMENADSARAFVKDVKRIIIKVIGLSVSLFSRSSFFFIVSSYENAEMFLSPVAVRPMFSVRSLRGGLRG